MKKRSEEFIAILVVTFFFGIVVGYAWSNYHSTLDAKNTSNERLGAISCEIQGVS